MPPRSRSYELGARPSNSAGGTVRSARGIDPQAPDEGDEVGRDQPGAVAELLVDLDDARLAVGPALGVVEPVRHVAAPDGQADADADGLIREYFPKGTSFTDVTDAQVQAVQDQLNRRPREVLNGQTPTEILDTIINGATTT